MRCQAEMLTNHVPHLRPTDWVVNEHRFKPSARTDRILIRKALGLGLTRNAQCSSGSDCRLLHSQSAANSTALSVKGKGSEEDSEAKAILTSKWEKQQWLLLMCTHHRESTEWQGSGLSPLLEGSL